MINRDDITSNIDPRFNGLRIRAGEDFFINEFSQMELNNTFYSLTASKEDEHLITESPSLDEVDQFYNPGINIVSDSFILEAITITRYAQTDKRMAAMVRVLNRFLKGDKSGIVAQEAIVGRPKKSGTFAYVTVQIPFSDGQTISMVFHSPEGDKIKIGPDDSLIAFRWLMNKRDITHVVAPEAGKDVSLVSVGKRITQLLIKNHDRFVKVQQAAAGEQKRLKDITSEIETLEEANTGQAERLVSIDEETEAANTLISDAEGKIGDQQVKNSEMESQITLLRAQKNARSVGGDPGGDGGATIEPIDAGEVAKLDTGIMAELAKVLTRFIATMKGFEDGDMAGYNISLFRSSFVNKLKTKIKNGYQSEVAETLEELKRLQEKMLKKPPLAARNSIWEDVGVDPKAIKVKADEMPEGKTGKRDPFWMPEKLPEEIRAALKKVIARPVIGEIAIKAPREVRIGGHLIMNAPRPLLGDSEKMWSGDFNHGRYYVAIDPNSEFAKQNIEENRKLDGWVLGYVNESEVLEYFKRGKYADRAGDVSQEELNSMFYSQFDKLTYPEFLKKFNAGGEGNAETGLESMVDAMAPIAELPEGWDAKKGTLGITYVKVIGDESVGVVVTPKEDGSFNIEKVSKGGEVREGLTPASDEMDANRIALEMMSQVDLPDANIVGEEGYKIWYDTEAEATTAMQSMKDNGLIPDHVGKTYHRESEDFKFKIYRSQEEIGQLYTEFRVKQDAEQAIIDAKEAEKKAEYENVQGFADDKTPMQRANLLKALNKNVTLDGVLTSRKKFIEDLVDAGKTTSTREENKVKEMSRMASFRANQQEQDEHERRILEAGKKTVYSLGGFDITKTEYDYANFLIGKKIPDVDAEETPLNAQSLIDEWATDSDEGYNPRESADNIEKVVTDLGGSISWKADVDEDNFEVVAGTITVEGGEGSGRVELTGDGKAIFFVNGERTSQFASSDFDTQESAINEIFDGLKPEVESKEDIEVLRLLDELDSIVVGNYEGRPDAIGMKIDEVAEALDEMGLLEKYDAQLNEAADVLTEELKRMSEGV